MIEYSQETQGDIPGPLESGVKVIGVGGAGANVLDRMALEGSDDAELLTLNTDIRALSTSVSSDKIQLGSTLLKGMGTGGDPSLGKQAALEAVDEIREAVRGHSMIFLCVGLGGGTGSGAAPEICRIVREEGVFLVVFATMPFTFEGARRREQAENALETIGRYANAVITFDNDRMGELIVPKDGVAQAFAAADKIISQSIRASMNIVFRPGIIRIGMDDLLSALNSKKSRCLFGYGVAKGDNRSHEALEQALKCPLLERGKLLNDARAVLVQVAGGETMTLYEVQLVMDEVTKHVGENTQILFGTGNDKRLGNSLAVTIISSIDDGESDDSYEDSYEEEEAPAVSLGAPALSEPEPVASPPVVEQQPPVEMEAPILAEEPDAEEPMGDAEPLPFTEEEPEPAPAVEPEPEEDMSIFEPLDSSGPPEIEEDVPAYAPQPLAELEEEDEGPPFSAEEEDMRNPIARAMEQGGEAGDDVAPIQPAGEEGGDVDRVEAVTDSSQKITLTRMVSSGQTGRIKTREPKDEASGPALPPTKPPALPPESSPEPSEDIRQQQEMLQLEPVAGKGRFAKTDPTIVDGEDLDVPTFLRKKK